VPVREIGKGTGLSFNLGGGERLGGLHLRRKKRRVFLWDPYKREESDRGREGAERRSA